MSAVPISEAVHSIIIQCWSFGEPSRWLRSVTRLETCWRPALLFQRVADTVGPDRLRLSPGELPLGSDVGRSLDRDRATGFDPLLPISARYQDGPPLTRGGATRAAVRLGALMSDFRPCSRVWSMSSSLRRVSPSMGPTMAGPYPSSFRWIVLVSISARQLIKRTAVNELLPSLYAPFGRKGLAGALTAEDHDHPRSLHNRVARAIGKSGAQVYRPGARER